MPAIPAVPPLPPDDEEPTNPGLCHCAGCDERRALELAKERAGVELTTVVHRPARVPAWRAILSTQQNPAAIGEGESEPVALRRALEQLGAG